MTTEHATYLVVVKDSAPFGVGMFKTKSKWFSDGTTASQVARDNAPAWVFKEGVMVARFVKTDGREEG